MDKDIQNWSDTNRQMDSKWKTIRDNQEQKRDTSSQTRLEKTGSGYADTPTDTQTDGRGDSDCPLDR